MAHGRLKHHCALELNSARHERRYVRARSLRAEKRAAHRQARANGYAIIEQALDELAWRTEPGQEDTLLASLAESAQRIHFQ
jgi:hypothetical protein